MEKQPMNNEQHKNEEIDNSSETQVDSTSNSDDSVGQQLAEMKDRWIRSVAELENLRKRSDREKQDAVKYAATSFARDMLSISDNLERAIATVSGKENIGTDVKPLLEGIEMVAAELKRIFENQGIKQLNPKGEKFDPNFHQAMFEVPTNEAEPGIIVEVVQQGFCMHDRLLRPAMVGVAKSADEN